jgi:hypothetical protein
MPTADQPISFLYHPFKLTLMGVRRRFGRSRVPDAIEFDGFRGESPRYHGATGGERIWLVYRIRLSEEKW